MEPYTRFEDAVFFNDPKRFNDDEQIKKNCEYIFRSSYLQHLKTVYSIFSPENIKLFLFEEMILDLNKYLNEICTFGSLEKYKFDISVKYNETRKSRFQLLSKIISPKRKSIMKKLIPLKQRTKIKEALRVANQKKEPVNNHKISSSTRLYLQNIFKKDIYELETFTGLPLKNYWQELYKNSQ
jgi:Sulfotransferase domain